MSSREEERRPPASHKDSLVVLEAGVIEVVVLDAGIVEGGVVKATSEW